MVPFSFFLHNQDVFFEIVIFFEKRRVARLIFGRTVLRAATGINEFLDVKIFELIKKVFFVGTIEFEGELSFKVGGADVLDSFFGGADHVLNERDKFIESTVVMFFQFEIR